MKYYPTFEESCRAFCEEHNIQGCNVCNKVVGECDYGGCHRMSTTEVRFRGASGRICEIRPSCAHHAILMRQAAPFGVA